MSTEGGFNEIAWQGCLDHANKNAAEARANADRLAHQLFEACEQRDEAQADARNAWAELKKQHDHVVISLAGYNKLVAERDEALAKYAACVDVVSFVDGRWVRTS